MRLRQLADEAEDAEVHLFALADVAHVISLGAHFGDQRLVVLHDHDRETGHWTWPQHEQTVQLVTHGNDELSAVVRATGIVVIRVAISAAISDSDVTEALGDALLADVTVTHQDVARCAVGSVRSAQDVLAIRQAFRQALALVRNARPNLDQIHLFVAAPPSVCFAVGQELSLRNSPPIQLYRYRQEPGRPSQQPAILLAAGREDSEPAPLSEPEKAIAAQLRDRSWRSALDDLDTYVANRQSHSEATEWFAGMLPDSLSELRIFPHLPKAADIIPTGMTVAPEPYPGDYRLDKTRRTWQLGDRLLVGLHRAADGDEQQIVALLRLFLFHEYLHDHNLITAHTAEEVGKFANCLEHLDFVADAYAIFHQFDLARRLNGRLISDSRKGLRFVTDQVELAIKSFWAFEPKNQVQWQVRRLRRYFNWYWRLAQLRNASDMRASVLLLSRKPYIEMGGLHQVAQGRRVSAYLDRRDVSTGLELGIVLENDRLLRIASSPTSNLDALLSAFMTADHEAIKTFFEAVYEKAVPLDGAQPKA